MMLKRKLLGKKQLLRYILSYVALIAFALTSANFLIETTLVSQMRTQQVERFERICAQQAATFQNWLNEMDAMKQQIESDPVLFTAFDRMSSFEYRDVVYELRKLLRSHGYLEAVQLYPDADSTIGYIFTDTGTMVPQGAAGLRAMLKPGTLPGISGTGLLLLDRPPMLLSVVFQLRSGAVLRFTLRPELVEQALLRGLPSTTGFRLFTRDGQLVAAAADSAAYSLEDAQAAASGHVLLPLNEGEYWLSYAYNDVDLFGPVYNAQRRMIRLGVLLTLSSLALALALAYRQYRPLEQLAATVRSQKRQEAASADEWALLRNFMDDLIDHKQAVQLPLLERQFNALCHRPSSEEELSGLRERLAHWLGSMPAAYRLILVTRSVNQGAQARRLRDVLAQPGPQRGIVLEGFFPEWIVCVVFGRVDDDRYLLERVYKLQTLCEREFGVRPTAAVSNPQGDLRRLDEALEQARQTMESRLPSEEGSVLFYDEMILDVSAARFRYPQELEQLLLRAVEQGEESTACAALDKLIEVLFHGDQPLRVIRFRCAGLCHNLLRALSDWEITLPGPQVEQLSAQVLPPQKNFREMLEAICIEACSQQRNRQQPRQPELVRQAQAYIQAHFCDGQLSLDSIAHALGVSVSHLGKQYKLATGESLMHDVQHRRHAWIKEQLRNTDLPINKLMEACGQSNPSSTVRRFREVEGMTPTAYRKLFRSS